jgi:outer membrane protein insertion porin family
MFVGRGWSSERLSRGLGLWENWAELRIPLVPGVLAWDFFFDVAEVSQRGRDIFHRDDSAKFTERLRFSYGGGLRMTIMQFPLRFLVAKRFIIKDGHVELQKGAMWGGSRDNSGVDFVVSFAIPTY